jgi:hypothetical protein
LKKKRSYEEMDNNSDAWKCGSGSIEEKVDHVSCNKTKKSKLDNTSSSPIKTTQLEQDSNGSHYEQSSNSPLQKSNGVTAVMAILFTLYTDWRSTRSKN